MDDMDVKVETSTKAPLVSGLVGFVLSHWAIIIPAAFLIRALYRRYASPLRKYPGPFLASVSRLWKVISTASSQTQFDHIKLHEKYGPVVRIAPNEISISSPEAARLLLSAGKRFTKTDFYSVFPPPENPDIFTEVREDVHARVKKVANVPYSMAAMQQLSPFIDDTIEALTHKLDGIVDAPTDDRDGPRVDLGTWLHWFAFDVLGEVAFSRSFGFIAEGKDIDGAIEAIDKSQRYNGIVGQVPFVDHLLRRNPLWKFVPSFNTANAPITKIAMSELDRRKPFDKESEGKWRGGDGRQDLLASLIKGHLKDPERFSEGDVFAVAHGAIFAGSDSTASTMQSFFWHCLSDPRVHEKLLDEINSAVASGLIPSSGNLSWTEAQTLSYLQACLKEAMRVRPAVGLNITRNVPPEGAELDGHFFRGGTRVAVNGWVLHRDKSVFGSDAKDFRPERWLEDAENAKRMDRYMFQIHDFKLATCWKYYQVAELHNCRAKGNIKATQEKKRKKKKMASTPQWSLTEHLLESNPEAYAAATQSPFLLAAAKGRLSKELLGRWLANDRLYIQGYIKAVGRTLDAVDLPQTTATEPAGQQPSPEVEFVNWISNALAGLCREQGMFVDVAARYGLDLALETGPDGRVSESAKLPGLVQFEALFASLFPRGWHGAAGVDDRQQQTQKHSEAQPLPWLEAAVVLWGTERVYLDAWSWAKSRQISMSSADKGEDQDGGAVRKEFIPNWTSLDFSAFVARLGGVLDRAVAREGEGEAVRQQIVERAKRKWDELVAAEAAFWPVLDS
ncbi:hypothetical protein PpBr36_03615 [Pyricularia pennisetigena]|uniref:hypothetical protein n=1 Tax=Pyricularia pennisetigena TaxID=1578925 RepID=UPI00114D78B8|nr:hypothetical protein PpBr36_03615 [Pyricularia pennisetigena]TLS30469.1 hypothetical protein PpBr36_03615 [Pyricularia pennisetigena]